MNNVLINFYCHGGKDNKGRTLREILAFNDDALEGCHDFIQWLFPTNTPSKYNPDAPILDAATSYALSINPMFHVNFKMALTRIFNFWGVKYKVESDRIIVLPLNYDRDSLDVFPWLWNDQDHNLLRMSRVMESARLLGYPETAKSFFEALLQHHKDEMLCFARASTIYWWYRAAFGTI